ncbi:hypothetical protein [Streptomyces iconiensis]|uniref:Endonuclease/Exonuclease/phosphatase family protein n=1 Tax=Streptomyces iconiensis TaxID=1384038 RepID=A0ABT6ZVS5_9ACTN|nr:hypothetical protein [Streptomyces iconiensis]MDJ1133171.1 hypothetical protein [Streptomyces iconiensis]
MRKRNAWYAALGTAALAAPLLCAPGAAAGPSGPSHNQPNNNPGFLQVYDANVENFPTSTEKCKGDWEDLLFYMRSRRYKPDVYTVQQVGGRRQLDVLLKKMRKHFGETYAGVVAQPAPAPGGGACGKEKSRQTNAVIWRTSRLSLKLSAPSRNIWQVRRQLRKQCVNNSQARTVSVKALLRDRVTGKNVTAASFHWPSRRSGASGKCAVVNAAELSREITEDGYGRAQLYLAGGDTNWSTHRKNSPGTWTAWYRRANGALGGAHRFRDPVYAGCAAGGGSVAKCLAQKWTFTDGRKRRIDVLLARTPKGTPPPTTSDAVVPSFDEADQAARRFTGSDRTDLDYSDHRAVGARIHY